MGEKPAAREVTMLLRAWSEGDQEAADRLFSLVYPELREISNRQAARRGAPVTLQATEILHEAWLRLADQELDRWENRSHFFGLAATMVRRVLLDHARYRLAARRDRRQEVELGPDTEPHAMALERAEELIQLNGALAELESVDPRRARVVELRYFGGLDVNETAEIMGISTATVKRDWRLARAWLRKRMEGGGSVGPEEG